MIIKTLILTLIIRYTQARRESRRRMTMTEQARSKDIASDAGHWYTQSGEPMYTIIGKNGNERPTTLRDARILNLLPSVTSILAMLPKPALITWMKKQVLMAALTLTRLPNEADEAYIARIMADADEQSRMAREKGTAIHGAIERFICGQSIGAEYTIYVRGAITALAEYLDVIPFLDRCEAEKSFANTELFYGGKVDLHSRSLGLVIDFKTKEFTEDTEKLAWDEQKIQLEAYRHGLGMPDDTRMLNVFISTSSPGLARVVEHLPESKHWETFQVLIMLYQILKRYNRSKVQ